MKVTLHQRWQVVCLFCVALLGLILLRYTRNSRNTVALQVNRHPPDPAAHAFAVEADLSRPYLSEAHQQHALWIESSLASILPERTLESKSSRRTFVTDREDYVFEPGKKYRIFYYAPINLAQPSLQKRVNALREELYTNLPVHRKREIRQEMNVLLEQAEFIKAMHEVVLLPHQSTHNDRTAHNVE